MRRAMTLMEILIVLCIVGIIAFIAIPNLMEKRRRDAQVEAGPPPGNFRP